MKSSGVVFTFVNVWNVFFNNFQKLVMYFVTFLWAQMLLEKGQS